MYDLLKNIDWLIIIPKGRTNFINDKQEQTNTNFFRSVILELNAELNEVIQIDFKEEK